MTRDEARNILMLYRPGDVDPQDVAMNEALQQVEQDAELSQWFAEHCARQSAVRTALRRIKPPSALKEQILSERPRPATGRPHTLRRMILASATALVLVLLGFQWQQHRAVQSELTFSSYRGRMVRSALRIYSMDLETTNAAAIRAFLGQQQARADYTLPAALSETKTTGCGVLKWQGNPVSMICFQSGRPLKPGQKTDLFLFVMKQDAAGGAPTASSPQIAHVNRMVTASWTEGDLTYVLAAEGDETFLRQFL